MLQLSEIISIFVAWFSNGSRHRGERLSFDPPENLQIRSEWVKSLIAASPAVAFILLTSFVELAHVNTCRCELIFILTFTGIAEPSG
jgi:hypothetical protein